MTGVPSTYWLMVTDLSIGPPVIYPNVPWKRLKPKAKKSTGRKSTDTSARVTKKVVGNGRKY